MPSCSPAIERVKPLLGTFVSVRVAGLEAEAANELVNRCFVAVAEVHALMSFQEHDSDVSRLNREAHLRPVQVDARTYDVLRCAAAISFHSGGTFDLTVAPRLMANGLGQRPAAAPEPDPAARWSDVELLPDRHVRFSRPLWIDVSGIAKGYAVDEVMKLLSAADVVQACVNAGGDLAVRGRDPERVLLDADPAGRTTVPVVELANGSMASSGPRGHRACDHIDGTTRESAPARFVSVLASTCTIADALTKVVIAQGAAARTVLRHFAATAIMSHDGDWVGLA